MMNRPALGLYGKIPAHGDFIDRELSVDFIRGWDSWLQQCIANSQERLGHDWLTLYLTSPIWRFMLAPGAIDQQCWAGVVAPSVDSVGRYFPLTIAAPLPANTALAAFCQQNNDWFQQLEAAALAALQDGCNVDQLSDMLLESDAPKVSSPAPCHGGSIAVQSRDLGAALAAQLDNQVANHYDSHSWWFSIYTEPAMQNLLLTRGMPTADQYAAMLDNQWQNWDWEVAGVPLEPLHSAEADGSDEEWI